MFEHVSIGAFLYSFSVFAFWMKSTPEIQPNHSEKFVRCVTTKQNQNRNENESKTAPKENENIDVWLVVWHSSCSAVTFTMQPILYRCYRAIEHWVLLMCVFNPWFLFFDSIPFSSHFYSYFKFRFFALATYCSLHYSLSVVILENISVSSLTISFFFFGFILFYIQCNINGFSLSLSQSFSLNMNKNQGKIHWNVCIFVLCLCYSFVDVQ